LLKLLLILGRLWQHISIDFYKLLINRKGYNMVLVIVDQFAKQTFLILCFKNIDAKETAKLFIYYVY
jgi:hypothetical protein